MERTVRRATRNPGLSPTRGRSLRPQPPLPVRHIGHERRLRRCVPERGRCSTSNGGHHRAGFLLCATGCLSAVNRPDIPGIDDFAGEIYYTGDWPECEPDFSGKRVGLVGTGSSGIQVAPILADSAASLTVFQRSPNYSVPMPNRPWTDDDIRRIRADYADRRHRSAYAPAGTPHTSQAKPAADTSPSDREKALRQRWTQGGVLFSKTFPDQLSTSPPTTSPANSPKRASENSVADPAVADDLIPVDHPIGTKRICTDTGYYETFNREHVRLVNLRREPITAVTATRVHTTTADYPCDAMVFATGFDAMTGALSRIDPVGPGKVALSELWADGPVTFLGMMVPGLPNLFTFSGPGSPSVLANMVLHAEVQVDWVDRTHPHRSRAGRHPGRRALGCRRGVDPSCRRGRRGHPVSARDIVVVPRGQHRGQEAGVHALRRRIRHLSNPLRRGSRKRLHRFGVHLAMNVHKQEPSHA